jgi:hypothetical protein
MAVDSLPSLHPLLRCVEELEAGLEAVDGSDPAYMARWEKALALRALGRVRSRARAIELSILANADDVAEHTGDRSSGAWLARETRDSLPRAVAAEKLGVALDRRWRRVAEAFRDGVVNETQAQVIVKALDALPDDLDMWTRDRAEQELVERAREFGPRELATIGAKVLEVIAPEIADEALARRLEAEERAAEKKTRLTMHHREDGTTDIRIRVPEHAASRLKVYLDSFTSPRQRKESFGDPGPGPADEVDRKPYAQRMGEAFCALLERIPSKVLPQHGGTATTVMVTLRLDQLISGLGAAELLTGEQMSVEQVRRQACTAGIIPVVLGSKGEILDLGRTTRLFSPAQQKAMAIRDRHCRAEGCDLPAAWCEAHHVKLPWALGGKTDLADGVLLCSRHHHRAHDARYRTRRMANGDLRFARRT